MALAGGFTFRMEDQRSYESHGDGLQSEDGLIHTFDVQASSSGCKRQRSTVLTLIY